MVFWAPLLNNLFVKNPTGWWNVSTLCEGIKLYDAHIRSVMSNVELDVIKEQQLQGQHVQQQSYILKRFLRISIDQTKFCNPQSVGTMVDTTTRQKSRA